MCKFAESFKDGIKKFTIRHSLQNPEIRRKNKIHCLRGLKATAPIIFGIKKTSYKTERKNGNKFLYLHILTLLLTTQLLRLPSDPLQALKAALQTGIR